jgi:hypothetical protein
MLGVHLESSNRSASTSLASALSKETGVGPKTKKPRSMAGLKMENKKPGSETGFSRRLAAFTAIHALIKSHLFRAEKRHNAIQQKNLHHHL